MAITHPTTHERVKAMLNPELVTALLEDKDLAKMVNEAGTVEEKQLLMLIFLRNNLNFMRDDLKAIKTWVVFFGIITVIGMILSIF